MNAHKGILKTVMHVNYANSLVMNVSQIITVFNVLMDGICYKGIVTKVIVLSTTLKPLSIKYHSVLNVTLPAGSVKAMPVIALLVSTTTI